MIDQFRSRSVSVECLKKGAAAVLEWPVRRLNISFDMGFLSMDCVVHVWCLCTKGRVTCMNAVI